MATRTNKRTGEVQEMQPDGSWKTLVPPSQGAPAFSVQTRPADPTQPFKVTKARNDAAASNYAPSAAQSDATIKGAQATNALDIANAQRDKAVADAKAAEIAATGGGPKINPQTRADAIAGYTYAKQLQDTVDQLNQLYQAGPGATQGIEGLKDFAPSPQNKNFDAAANKSRGIVGQTLGFTGGQLNTAQEAEKAVGPFIPEAGNFDTTILQKIQSLQDLANQGKAKSIQLLGGEPDANGNIIPVQPQAPPANPQFAPPPAPDLQLNGAGKTRAQIDPMLKAVAGKVGQMLSSGIPDAQINKFLTDSGVNPGSTNLGAVLKFRQSPDFKIWQRHNPGKAYDVGPSFYTKQIPVSDARRLFNKTAATDLGGDAAAGLAASANAISGGRLDNLAGDPEMARTGMDLLRGQHPYSSFAGDLAGQASLEALASTVPGARGLMMTKYGRRGADAAYGAYSGSGESDGNEGVGALTGALSGLGLGMFGRGLQKGAGRAATGIQNANLGYLNSLDIPMSVGRIARGANNDFGKTLGGIEDRLAGLPGMDAVIGDVRQQGDRAFSREALKQVDPSITKTGHEGLSQAYAAEADAYSKLNPVRIAVDHPFENGLNAVEIASKRLRHHGGDVQDVIGDIRSQIAGGEMKGEGYQAALQSIRKTRASLTEDVGNKASDALNALEQEVMDLGTRQGGQVGQDLSAANELHGRIKIMEKALKSSVSQRAGEVVPPSVLNAASIANTEKFGGLRKALSPDRPFHDLTTAGLDIMPTPTPDSGTAGRLAVLRGLGTAGAAIGGGVGALTGDNSYSGAAEGGGFGVGGGLTLGALLMAPYSKTGQRLLQKSLLAERPELVKSLGQLLLKHPKYAGLLGSAAGRDYFYQPEISQ